MASAEDLPVELLCRILELAAATSEKGRTPATEIRALLWSLTLVSHAWAELWRPFLYSTVAINTDMQAVAVLGVIRKHPERAALVKAFRLAGGQLCSDVMVPWMLRRCQRLRELELKGFPREGLTTKPWCLLLADLPIHTLIICSSVISQSSAILPTLRKLTLVGANVLRDAPAFVKTLPWVTDLSIDFDGDSLVAPHSSNPSTPARLEFVVAMAPQLVTLRLHNGTTGIPLQLILQIATIGSHLQRLDSTIIIDYQSSSFTPAPTLDSASLPPLQLGLIYNSHASSPLTMMDPMPSQEWLWALFEYRDDGAVDAIAARRRLEKVVLEPWLAERYADGVEYAVGKMKKKGLRLEFEEPDRAFFAE